MWQTKLGGGGGGGGGHELPSICNVFKGGGVKYSRGIRTPLNGTLTSLRWCPNWAEPECKFALSLCAVL